jgi:hypothetical protein
MYFELNTLTDFDFFFESIGIDPVEDLLPTISQDIWQC